MCPSLQYSDTPTPHRPTPAPSNITSTVGRLHELPPEQRPGRGFAFRFDASPGLYQFSGILDAREFDWEQLHETLDKFHNANKRTGPWDFSIHFKATPLVPSYWVTVNGKRVGLWFFERVSLEDIEQRRFRGKMAFWAEGATTVELAPYQPSAEVRRMAADKAGRQPRDYDWRGLRWMSALLETDPEDRLAALPSGLKDASASPAAQWAKADFWESLRSWLTRDDTPYRRALEGSFDWAMSKDANAPQDLIALLAAHRLRAREGALGRALKLMDSLIAQPTWGNPNPEGYSHNGDMGAMYCLRALAWAYHALADELGGERRERLLAKLRLQGGIFLDLALLNRDYWGGSVIQDHGWKSMFGFGVAALHLLGVLPEAERWVRYILPRLRRSLDAMPRDGVIPASSHYSPSLYLDELTQYRDALLARTGEDIFDEAQFPPIVDYFVVMNGVGDGRSGQLPLMGGVHFLNRMAAKYRDGRAAYLARQIVQASAPEFTHPLRAISFHLDPVYGALSHDPTVRAPDRLPPPPAFVHFPDSGLVRHCDREAGMVFSVSCGPYSGWNAYRHSLCPCDRLGLAPGEGHFTIALDSVPLLTTPDGGYRLCSGIRTCLLIDGQGQYGDIGYPMSIPSKRHRGEQIQFARWDEKARDGFVRLELTPAYPDALGLVKYTRDFLLQPGRITCRDTVVLERPRRLSWLFQGKREHGVAVEGLVGWFGASRRLRLTPECADVALTASVQPTEVVWAYSSASGFKPFDHVRYDSVEPTASAIVDFVVTSC